MHILRGNPLHRDPTPYTPPTRFSVLETPRTAPGSPLAARAEPFPPPGQVPWHHPPSPQALASRGAAVRAQASPCPSGRKFPRIRGLPTSPRGRGRRAQTPTSGAAPRRPSRGKRPETLRGHLRWPAAAQPLRLPPRPPLRPRAAPRPASPAARPDPGAADPPGTSGESRPHAFPRCGLGRRL